MNIAKTIEEKLTALKEHESDFKKLFDAVVYFCNHTVYGENYTYYIVSDHKFTVSYYNHFVLSARVIADGGVEVNTGNECILYELEDAENVIEKFLANHYCEML